MEPFDATDPASWSDRRNQGAAGVDTINNMPFVFGQYTQPPTDEGSFTPQSMSDLITLLYGGRLPMAASQASAAPAADAASAAQTLLGLDPNAANALLNGGVPSGGSVPNPNTGAGIVGGMGPYSWAPGHPVDQATANNLAAQPASFWTGVVDNRNLGLGRINYPGGPYGSQNGPGY